jgi:hypothetical protein
MNVFIGPTQIRMNVHAGQASAPTLIDKESTEGAQKTVAHVSVNGDSSRPYSSRPLHDSRWLRSTGGMGSHV